VVYLTYNFIAPIMITKSHFNNHAKLNPFLKPAKVDENLTAKDTRKVA